MSSNAFDKMVLPTLATQDSDAFAGVQNAGLDYFLELFTEYPVKGVEGVMTYRMSAEQLLAHAQSVQESLGLKTADSFKQINQAFLKIGAEIRQAVTALDMNVIDKARYLIEVERWKNAVASFFKSNIQLCKDNGYDSEQSLKDGYMGILHFLVQTYGRAVSPEDVPGLAPPRAGEGASTSGQQANAIAGDSKQSIIPLLLAGVLGASVLGLILHNRRGRDN